MRPDESPPPQQPPGEASKEAVVRRSARFRAMLNTPPIRPTPFGTDTAWALKLKEAVDTAVRELQVEIRSAKPVRLYDASDQNDMSFEMDTNKGKLQVTRARTGGHVFEWLN